MDKTELVDRRLRSWDNTDRRPFHADRRRHIAREMLEKQFNAALPRGPNSRKFQSIIETLLDLAL